MAESKSPIPVAGILNWIDYFDENREELKILAKSTAHNRRSVDWGINAKVSLYVGDITCLQVDGVVSPSNRKLEAKGRCGLAIRKAAGPELSEILKVSIGCQTGDAITTAGCNLPAKYIVHTAIPRGQAAGEDEKQLEKCYDSCLAEMDRLQMKSLAFSYISSRTFGYLPETATRVALQQVRRYLEKQKKIAKRRSIERIIFCLFYEADIIMYKTWMQIYFPCGSEDEYVGWLISKKEQLLQPGYGIVITSTEPDEVMDDDDPKKKRAKMPCGHVIGTETMTNHCKGFLIEGKPVKCPYPRCDATFTYCQVRRVACLTRRQMQEFERKASENCMRKKEGTQLSQNYNRREEALRQCPQCHVMCHRKDKNDPCVQCFVCTSKTNRDFFFCWKCLGVWNGGKGDACGNVRCVDGDDRIRVLTECPIKRILDRFDAPSIRGCPKCGLLIEYLCACTHMQCTRCDYCFCFLCLKGGAATKNDLTCRPFDSTCTIATRQTTLPGM